MSSLINKFSVSYNLEQASKKQRQRTLRTTVLSRQQRRPDALSEDVAKNLIELGYNIKQLMILVKIHPYSSVEEALNLLSKDPDTGKYNHKFYLDESPNDNKFGVCSICGGTLNEHTEKFVEETHHSQTMMNKSKSGRLDDKKPPNTNLISNNSNLVNNTNTNNSNTNMSKILTNGNVANQNNNNNDLSQTPLIADKTTLLAEGNKEYKEFPLLTSQSSSLITGSRNTLGANPLISSKNKFHFGKIDIPQETLESFESPDICRICFANKVNTSNISQITCGHFFCDNCIRTHMTTKIVNGQVLDIKCLMGGCPKRYNDEEIKANVAPEVYRKYIKFKNEQIKLNNPNKKYVHCPFPDCDCLVDCDNLDDDFVECEQHHTFCVRCKHLGIHKRGKCVNDDVILLQQIKKGNNDATAINYKQCPRCKVIIEKNEGCNQMHCINCGYNFCWLCLKKYTDDHYAMYNIRGCPGMRFESETGSKWMRKPCLKVLWYFFSCMVGFGAVFLILLFYLFFGCCYEFIKCYTKKKSSDSEDDEDLEGDSQDEGVYNVNIAGEDSVDSNTNNQQPNKKKKSIIGICLIGFLGFLCQPLYLMFYILYGLMECYRRFNCWFYYTDY